MFSGLVTTIASMPVDIAKTRLQNMKFIDGKKSFIYLKGLKEIHTTILQVSRNTPEREMCYQGLSRMRDSSPCGRASLLTTSDWALTQSSPSSSWNR